MANYRNDALSAFGAENQVQQSHSQQQIPGPGQRRLTKDVFQRAFAHIAPIYERSIVALARQGF